MAPSRVKLAEMVLAEMLDVPRVLHGLPILGLQADCAGANWHGEARAERPRPCAVRLEAEDGKPVQNSWNIEHVRKYHLRQFYP